jgi:hypothetical protein
MELFTKDNGGTTQGTDKASRLGNRATITKANGRTINALAMESTAGLMATATKAISSIAN